MKKQVTTFFLEMCRKEDFRPKKAFREILEVRPVGVDVFQHWMLFVGVGLPWRWYSRLKWSPAEWNDYLSSGNSKAYLAFTKEALVGYFELVFQDEGEVEIKFFGLFPSAIGAGLGGALLSHAVDVAWTSGAKKVWLHTCTSDHEAALPNYIARGFRLINQTVETEDIPEKEQYVELVTTFMSRYFDSQITLNNPD